MPGHSEPCSSRLWMRELPHRSCSLSWLQQLQADPPASFSIPSWVSLPREGECAQGIAACLLRLPNPATQHEAHLSVTSQHLLQRHRPPGPSRASPHRTCISACLTLAWEKHGSATQRNARATALLCWSQEEAGLPHQASPTAALTDPLPGFPGATLGPSGG